MTELRLRLLGVPEVHLGDQPVALQRQTSVALLGYLATTGRRYPRSMLTGLLAGDASEEQAQKRVSNTLAGLRAAVGEHLQVTRQWVAIDRERPHWVDVSEFEAQVAAREEPLGAAGAAAALDLYRGEFLAGVDLRDAPEFDEWLVVQRERLRLSLIRALQAALKGHLRSGPTSAAAGIAAARRLLELEPWSEDGHQTLMVLLARSGQRGAALKQYAAYRRVLAEELGIEPPPAADALAARLRARARGHAAQPAGAGRPVRGTAGGAGAGGRPAGRPGLPPGHARRPGRHREVGARRRGRPELRRARSLPRRAGIPGRRVRRAPRRRGARRGRVAGHPELARPASAPPSAAPWALPAAPAAGGAADPSRPSPGTCAPEKSCSSSTEWTGTRWERGP